MTPTSPTNTSNASTTSTAGASRPPTRNKSSSSLSTHTLRSLSSTSTTGAGKPRRNKSAVSLHHGHGHGAGHHNVQFTSHRKASHGAHGSQAMKRRSSSQSSSSTAGGANNPFGLGMTSMTRSDSQEGDSHHRHTATSTTEEAEGNGEANERPDLGPRRTSSSSSTATILGTGSRSRSRGGAKRQNSGDARGRDGGGGSRSRAGSRTARDENKVTPSGSVTSTASTNEWASETDSPLHIGRKLPDVEVQKDFKPEETSRLAMALESEVRDQPRQAQQQSRNATPSRLRKSKFQFAEDDDEEEEDAAKEGQNERQRALQESAPEIPSAAMPPAETPALPTMPAMLEAITPARSPEPDEVRAPEEPTAEQSQEAAATQAPAPPSAPQGISPPEDTFGQPPPVAGPEFSRSPSPMPERSDSAANDGRPGVPEPSLAQANVDEPNMAIEQDKEHQQKHQGLKSLPRPTPSGHDSPANSNKVTPEEGRSPAGPNPTTLQKEEQGQHQAKQPAPSSPSSSSQLPRPVRAHPTRKASNASVLSMASARSAAPSLISRMQPPPHFRRSASGIAPTVSREAVVRGEMATPSPEPVSEDGGRAGNEPAKSRRNGARSATFSHERTSSQTSNRSLRPPSAGATDSPTKRSHTYAAGEIQRSRTTEPSISSSAGGGGALAALGQIHQAATARTPSMTSPGGASEGSRTPGALTNAKRSASGYFSSALRGLTSLPSALTPPLSPSAGASSYIGGGTMSGSGGKHPIPGSGGGQQGGAGANSGSYSRSGGARNRASPSPQQPPLIVKFLELPSVPPPSTPSNPAGSNQDPSSNPSTSPRQTRPPSSLSQAHRNASSASLAMSRTQQKALLARDAPFPLSAASTVAPTSSHHSGHPSNSSNGVGPGLAPPPSPIPASQSSHPYLPSNPPSSSSSPAPSSAAAATSAASANGMQRWAFGLIKEAERIERQWRCIEKWRDPVGESLERVLHKSSSRGMERGGSGGGGSNSGRDSGNESSSTGAAAAGPGKLVRIQKGRSMTTY
ncbi:hypothetical protein JCM3766R1_003296 [Sporobolomyces carnicolor]